MFNWSSGDGDGSVVNSENPKGTRRNKCRFYVKYRLLPKICRCKPLLLAVVFTWLTPHPAPLSLDRQLKGGGRDKAKNYRKKGCASSNLSLYGPYVGIYKYFYFKTTCTVGIEELFIGPYGYALR
jgi:hypothetical protein